MKAREVAALVVGLGVGVLLSSALFGQHAHHTPSAAPVRRLARLPKRGTSAAAKATAPEADAHEQEGWQEGWWQSDEPCVGQSELIMRYPYVCVFGSVLGLVDVQDSNTIADPGPFRDSLVSYVLSDRTTAIWMPTSLGLCTNLQWLVIRTAVQGKVPTEFGALTDLQFLHISHNEHLVGSLPSELLKLHQCKLFQVDGNSIWGTVPSEFGTMQQLVILNMNENLLEGTLPSELGLLTHVTNLQLGNNFFELTVPAQLFHLTALELLDLRQNYFIGTLPTTIGRLSQLHSLFLGDNGFYGKLPAQMGHLSLLTILDLSSNYLQSSVLVLADLPALRFLRLDVNDFDGRLPRELSSLEDFNCTDSGVHDASCGWVAGEFLGQFPFTIVCALAGVVTGVIAGVGFFIWWHRDNASVRATNPTFATVTLLSLQFITLFPIPFGYPLLEHTDRTIANIGCKSMPLLLGLGSVGLFSSTFVRSFAIWRIFDNPSLAPLSLSPLRLLLFVVAAELVEILLLLPHVLNTTKKSHEPGCTVSQASVLYGQASYVGVWLLACGAMALKVRGVYAPHNETTLLGRATFNFITFGVALIVIATITQETTTRFLSTALCGLFSAASIVVTLHAGRISKVLWSSRARKGRVVVADASLRQPLVRDGQAGREGGNEEQGLRGT